MCVCVVGCVTEDIFLVVSFLRAFFSVVVLSNKMVATRRKTKVAAASKPHYEFGGPIGAMGIIFGLPAVCYGLVLFCNADGCIRWGDRAGSGSITAHPRASRRRLLYETIRKKCVCVYKPPNRFGVHDVGKQRQGKKPSVSS